MKTGKKRPLAGVDKFYIYAGAIFVGLIAVLTGLFMMLSPDPGPSTTAAPAAPAPTEPMETVSYIYNGTTAVTTAVSPFVPTETTALTTAPAPGTPAASAPAEAATLRDGSVLNTDDSPDNASIKAVAAAYGAKPEELVHVYSTSPNGMNYVFEFSGGARKADNFTRAFLIGAGNKIESVAAVDDSRKVGISSVENSLSVQMIKNSIIPQIFGS